jgi:parallel beta-helix repeat protein
MIRISSIVALCTASVIVGLSSGALAQAPPSPVLLSGSGSSPKPTASNTGWEHTGVSLSPSGSLDINTNGTVVDGKDISGTVTIRASNVTIRRSRVRSSSYFPVRVVSGSNVVIEDVEVDGLGRADKCIMMSGSGVIQRNNIHGCGDGIAPSGSSGITIKDNYVHSPSTTSGVHSDGVEMNGGSNMTFTNNNFAYQGATTAAVAFSGYYAPVSNITFDGNWVAGGPYRLWLAGNENPLSKVRITNNRFVRGGGYGDLATAGNISEICWSGNVYDDNGAPLNYTGRGSVPCN